MTFSRTTDLTMSGGCICEVKHAKKSHLLFLNKGRGGGPIDSMWDLRDAILPPFSRFPDSSSVQCENEIRLRKVTFCISNA